MSADTNHWLAPPPAPTPEPQQASPRRQRPIGLIAALVALLLAIAALGTFSYVQHGHLVDAQAHAASVTSDLHGTRKSLADTKGRLTNAQSANSSLQSEIATCRVAAKVGRHMTHVAFRSGDALDGDVLSKFLAVRDGNREFAQANRLLNAHGYRGDIWGLFNACGGGSGSNT